jgi:uncharacterized membrane protein YhaH (DUF805 family)
VRGLSRSVYWACMAGAGVILVPLTFALWPYTGFSLLGVVMILCVAAAPFGILFLWVQRLRNAGRSGWWMLLVALGPIPASISYREMLISQARLSPKFSIPGYVTEQELQNAILPDLVPVVGLGLACITLIIGLLPTKSLQDSRG